MPIKFPETEPVLWEPAKAWTASRIPPDGTKPEAAQAGWLLPTPRPGGTEHTVLERKYKAS